MKKTIFFLVVFFFIQSCVNNQSNHSNDSNESKNGTIEFTEERRLNHSLPLTETYLIKSNEDLIKLYANLKDPNIPRSAPIPLVDFSKESILVLKPKLVDHEYADIEVLSIQKNDSMWKVNYKEVENWEFTENKWKNPIIILKIEGQPERVLLEKTN